MTETHHHHEPKYLYYSDHKMINFGTCYGLKYEVLKMGEKKKMKTSNSFHLIRNIGKTVWLEKT